MPRPPFYERKLSLRITEAERKALNRLAERATKIEGKPVTPTDIIRQGMDKYSFEHEIETGGPMPFDRASMNGITDLQYLQLKQKIETEYRENLNALERMRRLSQTAHPTALETSPKRPLRKDALGNVIRRDVLPQMQGEFTKHEVLDKIREKNPGYAQTVKPDALSTALIRLCKEGKLERIEQGIGRRPNRYKLVAVGTQK
jgi:hypothetical protein